MVLISIQNGENSLVKTLKENLHNKKQSQY